MLQNITANVSMELTHSLAGFLVGMLVGFTGVGGGALMTPVLIFLLGVAPHTAVGTDLLFASLTKGAGGWVYGARGSIDWLVLRRLSLGSLPAAAITLLLIKDIEAGKGFETVLLQSLGWMLAVTGVTMIFRSRLHHIGQWRRTVAPERFKQVQPALTVAAGALLGVLVTLTSVGAGALGAVILLYLYPYRLTPKKLVGTDIAHAIPLTLVAGLGHLTLGNIDFALLGSLLMGSIPGVLLGSRLGVSINGRCLQNAIAAILMFVGVRLVLNG
ncbi:sulfite exporter TauE/SafE family protein [Herbaspirillum sp. GCM10030257]|uniref:sulfite exporter TauE/SafE family protein n=1 Tax=Herbaspirillum sp. GCM10030257 TaxID=3273393 RepID=UPI00360B61A4